MTKSRIVYVNQKSKKKFLEQSYERIGIVALCILFALIVEMLKIIELSIFSNVTEKYQRCHNITHFQRKNILDRNGVIISSNVPTASVYINPKFFPKNSLDKVAPYSSMKKEDFISYFYRNKNFIWLRRHLTPQEQEEIHNLGLPGIYFVDDHKRIYPQQNLFSHVIGTVDVDNRGISGLELYVDKSASEHILRDALVTSLDVNVQYVVRDILKEFIDLHAAKSGNALVINVTNGEIISSISLPDFNPNHHSKISERHFNQISSGLYELGSILKPLTLAIALDTDSVRTDEYFDITKPLRYSNHVIKEYRGGKQRPLSIPEIIMYSSNVGIAYIVESFGIEVQKKYFKRLGMLDKINLEIFETVPSVSPSDSKWTILSAVTMGYGYGISLSPLHFMQAFSTIVNGGFLHDATLLSKKKNKSSIQVFRKDTSETMNKILYLTATKGTARKANAIEYVVGAKTGTAEIVFRGQYNKKVNRTVCAAAFPMHSPKYAVFVMINEPKANKLNLGFTTGGMVAAPTVKKIIEKIAPMMEVYPIDPTKSGIGKILYINEKPTTYR
jgi:cell division protein FtsI (penicillin-binding protein 3)